MKYYVGIDIGHGESAATCYGENGFIKRLILNDKGDEKIFSSFYIENHKTVLIANQQDGELAALKQNLVQGFKGRIDEMSQDNKKFFSIFVKELYKAILRHNKYLSDANNTTKFYVACPTEWSIEDAKKYMDCIYLAGVPVEWITSEANAAYLKHSESIEIGKNVLIIDYGSSTIDYCAFTKSIDRLNIIYKNSVPLGAHQVEDSLMYEMAFLLDKYNSSSGTNYTLRNTEGINFFLRMKKEEYFSGMGIPLEIKCLKEMSHNLPHSLTLGKYDNKTLDKIDDYKGYCDRINVEFATLKQNLDYHYKFKPDIVILSGSAIKMDFVSCYIQEIYDERVEIRRDTQPQYVVSDGISKLAYEIEKNTGDERYSKLITAYSEPYRAIFSLLKDTEEELYDDVLDKINTKEASRIKALCYYFGIGVNKSAREAYDILVKDTSTFARTMQAYMLYRGQGIKMDHQLSLTILNQMQGHGKSLDKLTSALLKIQDSKELEHINSHHFIKEICEEEVGLAQYFDFFMKNDSTNIVTLPKINSNKIEQNSVKTNGGDNQCLKTTLQNENSDDNITLEKIIDNLPDVSSDGKAILKRTIASGVIGKIIKEHLGIIE